MSNVLEINQRVESQADAERLAKKKLAAANKREVTASIKLLGDIRFSATQNIELEDFGAFDGKYTIEKVTHSISGSGGFVTTLDLHMGNKAKGAKKKSKGSGGGGTIYCDSSEAWQKPASGT